MASSVGTTAPRIKAEINDLLVQDDESGYDDYDDWMYEGFADEESNNLENESKTDISLFLTLFESSIGILEQKIKDLRAVADGLERVHYRTTMGSLTGGVVSVVGGVASLLGLALAPFTMGASLAVTQVGAVTALAGGLTSGVSNITNMVNESMDRKSIERIIQDFTIWMEPISECLTELNNNNNITIIRSTNKKIEKESPQRAANIERVGCQLGMGMGLGASLVSEAAQLTQAANLGRVAAKAHRGGRVAANAYKGGRVIVNAYKGGRVTVNAYKGGRVAAKAYKGGRVAANAYKAGQVAKVLTGAFSGLFIAMDLYFITQDAKEIQNINGANKESAAVKFIAEVRETANQLEDGLDELREITKALPQGDTH